MSNLLSSIGVAFLVLSVAAAIVLTIMTVVRAIKPDAATTQGLDIPGVIKAISAAPLWLALAIVGAGLCVLGSMYDGYRIADGGLTKAPPVAASAAPVAEANP